jgi:hypothetical protein
MLFRSVPAWTPPIIIFLVLIWGWLFIPSALLIILSFPRRVWPLRRWPRATPMLIFGLPLVGALFALAARDLGPYFGLLTSSALAVVVGGVAITLHTFLRVRDRVVRAQTAWMLVGLVVGFAYWPLENLLPNLRLPPWIFALIFPLSLGIAITRYRLFDIEIIIRRTLIYSTLTLILGLLYLGVIVVLQALLVPVVGGSELAIVVSTLLIAALFFPLRRRIQNVIDRRFFRRKYNAQQVLAAFAVTARDETDIQCLTDELLHVVDTTVQPEFVGLWLRSVDGPHRAVTGNDGT